MSRFDAIWGRISRAIAFASGVGIMWYEAIWDRSDRPWLYAAAIGMMGLPIARTAEMVLGRMAGNADSDPVQTPKKDRA